MKKICLFFLLLLFVGCSRTVVHHQKYDAIQQQQIKRWILHGRLFLSSKVDSGTVTFYWSQDNSRYLMRFTLPFGQGSYVLSSTEEQGVSLVTAKNQVLYADDVESLLHQSLGWHIPVTSFSYWVRGLPEPGITVTAQEFDKQGRVTAMQQEDWKISIKHYTNVNGIDLPSKVFVQGNQLELKLVIRQWDIAL